MALIGSLPLEIVDLIAEYLSVDDTISCLCVSQIWRIVFEHVIYRTVDTRHRSKFMAFSERLLATVADPNPLGHYVRELSIGDGFMTLRHLDQLRKLCPFVDTLTFRWTSGALHDRHMATRHTPSGSSRRYFGTPERILRLFAIKKLKLVCDTGRYRRRMDSLVHEPTLYLKGAQNVRHLSLIGAISVLTYSQMDAIHRECPRLTHLHVSIDSHFYIESAWAPGAREVRELDGPGWMPPASDLQHIHIDDESRVLDSASWIRYFAAMYPNVLSIILSNRCMEWVLSSVDEDVSPTPLSYQGGALLADRCPRLRRVELDTVTMSASVVKHMFSGKKLEQVVIKDVKNFSQPANLAMLVGAICKAVTKLEMTLPARLTTTDLVKLSICDKLVELKLVESNIWSEDTMISIDRLLAFCPALSRLTLMSMNLEAFQSNRNLAPNRLKSLHLYNCSLCYTVMSYLSVYCQDITELYMISCKGSGWQGATPSVFPIHLASHHLRTLAITGHRFHYSDDMKFVSLQVLEAPPSYPGDDEQVDCEGTQDGIFANCYLFPDYTRSAQSLLHTFNDDDANKELGRLTSTFAKLTPSEVCRLRKWLKESPTNLYKRPTKRQRTHPGQDAIVDLSRLVIQQDGFMSICCASVKSVYINGMLIAKNNTYVS